MIYIIKTVHTVIWGILVLLIFYLLYAGISNHITKWVWFGLSLVLIECLVIIFNKGKCPLTPLAAKYTDDRRHNFDIYLPEWLAQYNKIIFSTLLLVAIVLIVIRKLN